MLQRRIHFHKLVFAILPLICIGFTACASKQEIFVSPDVPQLADSVFQIKGRVSYDGNKDYLPRTIIDQASSYSPLTFQYIHATSYGMRDMPALTVLINPLTRLGYPLGENAVISVGKLSVIMGEETIKSYSAICSIEITRNLFSQGSTFSEMRKESLIAVRDNIEFQLYHDREFLTNLTHASSGE